MRPRTLRIRLALAALGAVLAGASLGTGIAKADRADDYTAANAWRVCAILDRYPTDAGVAGVAEGIADDGHLSLADTTRVLVDSVAVWCPRNQPVLDAFVAGNATVVAA